MVILANEMGLVRSEGVGITEGAYPTVIQITFQAFALIKEM